MALFSARRWTPTNRVGAWTVKSSAGGNLAWIYYVKAGVLIVGQVKPAIANFRPAQSYVMLDRYRGALLGLAIGDALGTALEFKAPGTFEPLTDIIGGDPFNLKPGEWTDDTSMALCLSESLIDRRGFDAKGQ